MVGVGRQNYSSGFIIGGNNNGKRVVLVELLADLLEVGASFFGDVSREAARVVEEDEGNMRRRDHRMRLLLRQNARLG